VAGLIVAKWRDRYMAVLARQHPGYGFERHVGYGTAAHRLALKELGASTQHRRSWTPLKAWRCRTKRPESNLMPTTTELGHAAEQLAAEYLTAHGYPNPPAATGATAGASSTLWRAKTAAVCFVEVK